METITVGQLLFLLIISSAKVVIGSFNGNETDRLSLVEFKKAITHDPQQVMLSWNDSTHFCNWEGVLCRVKNLHHVTSLNLSGRGLVGNISPSIGNLTFLRYLFLPNNGFMGQIPSPLGHLRRIRYIYLSSNTLQGEIPVFANCSSLKGIWLDDNCLVGQMPTYANLPPLIEALQISYNNLTGKIPPSISNITALIRIRKISTSHP